MLSVTDQQLMPWVVGFLFTLARILAFCAASPGFGEASVPKRVRLIVGLALSIAVWPAIGLPPDLHNHPQLGLLFVQQALIGLALGLVMRFIFAATDIAGNLIGMQSSLSFATAYDLQTGNQTPLISNLMGWLALAMFLSMDGHLMMFVGLVQSYTLLPVELMPGRQTWWVMVQIGGMVFQVGLMLALPMLTALLITNIALGVMTRSAPTLNLFSVGFPIALIMGFGSIAVGLQYWAPVLEEAYRSGFQIMGQLISRRF